MGEMMLCPEILEHILQFVDGETLLMCREVSDEFAAAVKYLSKTRNIWEQCYLKEKEMYPYCVISKFHPHNEGLNHPKNWGLIYETCLLGYFLRNSAIHLSECKIGRHYSDIVDVETHEDLLFILVKYNKNYSLYYRIITINLKNNVVDKSCRFFANMLYITPIEDPSSLKSDSIILSCDLCQVVAVPVYTPDTVCTAKTFPKFERSDKFLTIEHSNGELLWFSDFKKIFSKGYCFHSGKSTNPGEIMSEEKKSIKVCQIYRKLYITWGETCKELNTFKGLQADVTASFHYSNFLFLGTDIGMLYAYCLNDKSDLEKLKLECYFWRYDVCPSSIVHIDTMELKNEFVIVCCSVKNVYRIHIKRKLKNF